MAALDNMNKVQFFHGSTHTYRRGQIIDPTAPHPSNFESSDADKFYMDTRQSKATEYVGLQDAEPRDLYHPPGAGSVRSVYTVQPLGKIQPDARRGDDERYDPDDHATAFETTGKVKITGRHLVTDDELYS